MMTIMLKTRRNEEERNTEKRPKSRRDSHADVFEG